MSKKNPYSDEEKLKKLKGSVSDMLDKFTHIDAGILIPHGIQVTDIQKLCRASHALGYIKGSLSTIRDLY